MAQRRPWSEVVDRSAFAKPDSLADATGRIRKNLGYFRVNYVLLLLFVIALSLLYHPVSLFILTCLMAAWTYLCLFRTEPLVLFNRVFSDREVVGMLSILSILVVFLLSDVGSLLISSFTVGVVLICAHGAFRVPDDLFLDDQESSGGFLSFLGSGNPPPPIASHV
ncbi:hypothetical protein O6H91_10G092100 [Diphasiastrum complanatum]|nr:hypothetical protein O6H91_10G092100 [Diphasiastrum complanatum]